MPPAHIVQVPDATDPSTDEYSPSPHLSHDDVAVAADPVKYVPALQSWHSALLKDPSEVEYSQLAHA